MQLPHPLRTVGQRLLRGVPVRVRSGINEGFRWSLASSGRGYASGRFAADRLAVLAALVRPGDTFWDVGAHKGFVTLAASRLVGPDGRVVSVEPGRSNLWFLRRHLAWNGIENVEVVPRAVGGESGTARFGGRGDSLAYRLGRGPDLVEVTTLAALSQLGGRRPPAMIKMDIEGQEAAALEGAGEHLPPESALMISVHGRALYDRCRAILSARGFRILESGEMARRSADPGRPWGGDHDLVALGPGRHAAEGELRSLALFQPRDRP